MIGGCFHNEAGQPLLHRVSRTESAWERMRGLLGRPALQAGEALWIAPCNSVHSLLMGYPIDLLYLDRSQMLIKIIHGLKPWRFSLALGAASVVETPAGTARALGLTPGCRLIWQACS